MDRAVSAADANRKFSKLLRAVRDGQSYVVTSHGEPVARIVPIRENGRTTRRARSSLLRRLRSQGVSKVGRWTRDELYEDRA